MGVAGCTAYIQFFGYGNCDVESIAVTDFKQSRGFSWMLERIVSDIHEKLESGSYRNNPSNGIVNDNTPKYRFYIASSYSESGEFNPSLFNDATEALYVYKNGEWSLGKNTSAVPIYRNGYIEYMVQDHTFYLALDDAYMQQRAIEWGNTRSRTIEYGSNLLVYLCIALLSLCLLIWGAGRKAVDDALYMMYIDRLYTEVNLGLCFGTILFWVVFVESLWSSFGYYQYRPMVLDNLWLIMLIAISTAVAGALLLMLLLSLVRKIKAGRLLKHTIVWTICRKIFYGVAGVFDNRLYHGHTPTQILHRRQWMYIALSVACMFIVCLGFAVPPFFFLGLLLEIALTAAYVFMNRKTYAQISDGISESAMEQLKAERTKVELITNVSHDLRSPLTSIISYIDLLRKAVNEHDYDPCGEYAEILAAKAARLAAIVSDLFDLAKSAGGTIELTLERIDVVLLVKQTLADMEDSITGSGLTFKTMLPNEPIYIMADGKKLYRVMQNIVNNTLAYAMQGSRVYVDVSKQDGRVTVSVKNMSAYEMTFTAEDVLTGFYRGDKSRSGDGSGLGLSIAAGFTRACGGRFDVAVDGDLFKVILSFDITNNE